MPPQLPDYSDSVRAAVADYWEVRRSQADESESRGVVNTGIRAEVTGGPSPRCSARARRGCVR